MPLGIPFFIPASTFTPKLHNRAQPLSPYKIELSVKKIHLPIAITAH